jgi:hypothetical protein
VRPGLRQIPNQMSGRYFTLGSHSVRSGVYLDARLQEKVQSDRPGVLADKPLGSRQPSSSSRVRITVDRLRRYAVTRSLFKPTQFGRAITTLSLMSLRFFAWRNGAPFSDSARCAVSNRSHSSIPADGSLIVNTIRDLFAHRLAVLSRRSKPISGYVPRLSSCSLPAR